VFTTSEGTAEDLLKHQHVWSLLFDFTEIKKDEKWYKIVAHGIPTAFFNIKEGMQLVKDEVETFNKDIKLAMLPHWLTSEEARQGKQHGSIVLTVKTNQEVQNALRNRLIIAGTSVRTAVYTTCKPTDQCRKCQKFGHLQTTCKTKIHVNSVQETTTLENMVAFYALLSKRNYLCTHSLQMQQLW
jgi:hypothetical protein